MTVSLNATRRSFSSLAISAVLTLTNAPVLAQTQGVHVSIVPDASASFRGAVDETFAQRVARDVVGRLPEFAMRSKLTFLPLGEYGTRNPVREAVVSRRFTPQAALQSVEQMIAGFPAWVAREGAQQSTNILGALDQIAQRMDCSAQEGHVFVLSDGQETGQTMSMPSHPMFEGCVGFTIIGVLGEDPAQTRALGDFWMRWCEAAGFQRCAWLS